MDEDNRSMFIIAYIAVALSSFVMGSIFGYLLRGWLN